jgi:hypothetical protein
VAAVITTAMSISLSLDALCSITRILPSPNLTLAPSTSLVVFGLAAVARCGVFLRHRCFVCLAAASGRPVAMQAVESSNPATYIHYITSAVRFLVLKGTIFLFFLFLFFLIS